MPNELFLEVAAVILTAGLLSLVLSKLRQPLVIGYIITGMIVGPGLLGLTKQIDVFSTLSSVGIAFLLFIVGLNLNWRSVREVGVPAILAGSAQVVFTSAAGFGVARLVGFDVVTGIFLGIAFSFSSTIIIVKLLTDKRDLDRLYGRIAIGILIVQDLAAMVILLVVAALRGGGPIGAILSVSLGKGVAAIFVLWFLARFFIPRLFRYAAHSQELLFLVALAWCFAVASALQLLGFGIEIGALFAGVALAGTGFQHEIEAKIRPLRDFFLVMFFIVLGTNLSVASFSASLVPALIFSAFVLVGNPIIAFCIMRALHYHPRTAFLTGTTVAQISEFSFILLGGGIAAGLLSPSVLPLATVVAIVTIAISTYLISFNDAVYSFLARVFPFLGNGHGKGDVRRGAAPRILLFGFDRMGEEILPMLASLDDAFLVVDFNPVVVERLAEDGIPHMYGDVESADVLSYVHAEGAKLIVSTIPDMHVNVDVLDYVKERKSAATVIVTARSAEDAKRCYELGATFVIVPSVLSGQRFADLLKKNKTRKTTWKAPHA